jgi:hypothetical protein
MLLQLRESAIKEPCWFVCAMAFKHDGCLLQAVGLLLRLRLQVGVNLPFILGEQEAAQPSSARSACTLPGVQGRGGDGWG